MPGYHWLRQAAIAEPRDQNHILCDGIIGGGSFRAGAEHAGIKKQYRACRRPAWSFGFGGAALGFRFYSLWRSRFDPGHVPL